jgi:hypothetical protein
LSGGGVVVVFVVVVVDDERNVGVSRVFLFKRKRDSLVLDVGILMVDHGQFPHPWRRDTSVHSLGYPRYQRSS